MSEKFMMASPEPKPKKQPKQTEYTPEDYPKSPWEMTEDEYVKNRAKDLGIKNPSEKQLKKWRADHRKIIKTKPKENLIGTSKPSARVLTTKEGTKETPPAPEEPWRMTVEEYITLRAKEAGVENPTREQQIAWSQEHTKIVENHFSPLPQKAEQEQGNKQELKTEENSATGTEPAISAGQQENPPKQEIETSPSPPTETEEKFFNEFGIDPEDLLKIEGYTELSVGRKLLVLENLKQLTLARIEEETRERHKQKIAQSKLLGKLWKSASKYYQIAKLEKAVAKDLKTGGLAAHGEILEQLIQGAKNGPEASLNEKGEIEIQFAAIEDFNRTAEENKERPGLNELGQSVFKEYAEAAKEFGSIPYEWSLETASKSQRKQFEKAREKYEVAKSKFAHVLRVREKTVSRYTIDVEQKMAVNRYLTAHPDVEKQLQKIGSKSAWTKVFKDTITERGLYFTAGFAVRSLAFSFIGLAAAPITAAAIGGFRARQRAKETVKLEEKGARRGKTKTEKIKTRKGKMERKSLDFADADNLTERLEKLITRLETETGSEGEAMTEKEKTITEKNLGRLVQYAYQKYKDGLINFGGENERFLNHQKFIAALGKGESFSIKLDAKTNEKLEKILALRKEKISKKEEKYIRKEIVKGALIAAGFASAGWLARHFISDLGISKAPDVPKDNLPADDALASQETVSPETFIEKVQRGDSIWKLAERQLKTHYGEKFTSLKEGQKTFLIDSIKDKIAADPEKFGLTNPDQIKPGDTINFSDIFREENEVQNMFGRAESLEEAAIGNIEKNNALIEDWVHAHPNEPLTSDKVEEILSRAAEEKTSSPAEITETEINAKIPSEPKIYSPEAQIFGSIEEAHAAKTFGFTPREYQDLRDVSVGEFLDQIPAYGEAPEVWVEIQNRITLPRPPRDLDEFEKLMRLSAFIRENVPFMSGGMRAASIGTFLKKIWPEK